MVVFIVGLIGFGIYFNTRALTQGFAPEPIYTILILTLGLASGILTILFHLKTFKFLNDTTSNIIETRQNTDYYSIEKYFWVGVIVFGIAMAAIGILTLYLFITEPPSISSDYISVLTVVILINILGFGIPREAWLMRMRIRNLKNITMDQLDEIGQS